MGCCWSTEVVAELIGQDKPEQGSDPPSGVPGALVPKEEVRKAILLQTPLHGNALGQPLPGP